MECKKMMIGEETSRLNYESTLEYAGCFMCAILRNVLYGGKMCPSDTFQVDEECYAGFRTAVHALGTLDALLSLSAVARLPGYVRPNYRPTLPSADDTNDGGDGAGVPETGDGGDGVDEIVLRGARHPTVERVLEGGFVPNDINLR